MTGLQIVVLALIQGLTEFLPVSSSAHLILGRWVFSWPDQGLVLDLAVHFGTLVAVLIYFRNELLDMVRAMLSRGPAPHQVQERRLGWSIILASIPVLLVGLLAYDFVEHWLRDLRVIALATLVFGILLWVADRCFPARRKLAELGLSQAMMIGLAQVLALVPGTSRSGITITAGRMLGFDADAAARFSFLLSIPVIAAAGADGLLKVWLQETAVRWQDFGLAVVVAAVAGWMCIAAFLALLKRVGLLPFVIYRLLLAAALLYIAF